MKNFFEMIQVIENNQKVSVIVRFGNRHGQIRKAMLHPKSYQDILAWKHAIDATLDDGTSGFVRRIKDKSQQRTFDFMEDPEFEFIAN